MKKIIEIAILSLVTGEGSFEHGIEGFSDGKPLVIAHRGASGIRPAHSVDGYRKAIEQGADIIECDLAVTKDLKLVCLHDEFLSGVTDVASIEKFGDRRRRIGTKLDWFVIDFTLKELKELRLKQERDTRDKSFDFKFEIPTLEEYIEVAQNASNTVGIYPETKKPDWYHENLEISHGVSGWSMEMALVETVKKYGYKNPSDPCFLQSFNFYSLRKLSTLTQLPLIFLMNGQRLVDYDYLPTPDFKDENYDWKTWPFWENITEICYGIGPDKKLITVDKARKNLFISNLVDASHENNIKVHPWTFRNEDEYLNFDYDLDPYREFQYFYDIGIDGYFTDFSGSLVTFLSQKESAMNSDEKKYLCIFLLALTKWNL